MSRLAIPIKALGRRPTLAAALIYLVLSVTLVAPALLTGKTLSNSDLLWFLPPWNSSKPAQLHRPSNLELADAPIQLQPFVQYTKSQLPHIPLWNPYIMGGRPFLANAQSAVFSPYSLPAYVLPFWTSLAWTALLKFFVAAFGMFLLGRALGMRFGGALLAGVVYAFNLWMVTWVTYPHESVWTWMPWMLLLTERLVRRPDVLSGAGLAAVVGVQFLGGHPESSFHALVATAAFFVLRLVQARRSRAAGARNLRWPVLAFGGALVGGVALAALVLLPFTELLLHSADLGQRAGTSVDLHVQRKYALEIFLSDYWGRPTGTAIDLFLLSRAFYAGALPLMLAAAALILRPKAERLWIAIFGFGSLAVVLGIPPFLQIVTRLPVFSSGHNIRLVALYMLCLAPLAGWGLDEVCSRVPSPRRARVMLASATVVFAVPIIFFAVRNSASPRFLGRALDVAWGFATPPGNLLLDPTSGDVIRLASLIVWIPLAAAGLVLLALRLRGRPSVPAFVVLAVVLVTADLFRAGMGYNPAIAKKFATQPATPAIRYLQARRPARFASIGGLSGVSEDVIPIRFRLYEARGYDLPIMKRFDRFWRREIEPEYPSQVSPFPSSVLLDVLKVRERGLRALRFLGTTDVFQNVSSGIPDLLNPESNKHPVLRFPGLHVVYSGRDGRIYRLDGALPRAFMVDRQQVVSGGEAALNAVTSPAFDGRRAVVTEGRIRGLPEAGRAGAGGPKPPAGGARIVSYKPERVVIRATAARPGLLVLGDNYYPGWGATVDGRPTHVSRVDYLFRGVRVGPGVHTVEFRYKPLSWRIGWIVSLVSMAGLALAVFIGIRRRRTASASEPAVAEIAEDRVSTRT